MKNVLLLLLLAVVAFSSCTPTEQTYKVLNVEKHLTFMYEQPIGFSVGDTIQVPTAYAPAVNHLVIVAIIK